MGTIDYDFVEIGTSDFDNLIETADDTVKGLSIEPVKIYFDKLPSKANVKKLNCAVSDKDAELTCYWVHPDDIVEHSLPNWVRGCGTINHQHPLIIEQLSSRQLMHLYRHNKCEVMSWSTLVERESIRSIKFLKIDAEGSDYAILESILNSTHTVLPQRIQFENKDFADGHRLQKIVSAFLEKNYYIGLAGPYDIVLER